MIERNAENTALMLATLTSLVIIVAAFAGLAHRGDLPTYTPDDCGYWDGSDDAALVAYCEGLFND